MNGGLALGQLQALSRAGLGAPVLLLAVLAMMVLPLPPLGLDLLFTFNIALSLVVLLAVVYSRRPLDFGAFPTVLLVATLLRLALNVASTRVVLLRGHSGTDAAGHVIQAFGEFVIGGNYAVGFVVFLILVVINFVVVTKGAGRISEVSARFTLDAMPGKQMAIDADLNAGVISQEEAKARRQEVSREADFYGAMDGASKFVRGDAIAGVLILVINILGGLAVGMGQHDMSFADAAQVFTLLTIGDGLVAQVPSLLLATSAAIMVTRVSVDEDMGAEVLRQLFATPRTLMVTSGVLVILGVIPGMPNLVFLALGALSGAAAWWLARRAESAAAEPPPAPEVPPEGRELDWDDVALVDPLGLEVGYRLIALVDRSRDGTLLGRLRGVRKKLSQELGFLVPAVHIRDNLELGPTTYRITVFGATIGEATVMPDRELAINPGQAYGQLDGTPGRDPVFGLEAVWIEPAARDQAQALGYTVVDAATVIATHMSQVIQDHAHELLGHQEVQQLLDRLAQTAPRLVEDLVPKVLPLATVVRVLQNLLREQVPVRDIRTVLEALSAQAAKSQDPDALTAAARVALGRTIVQRINGLSNELPVATLDPSVEQLLLQAMQMANGGEPALEPGLASRLIEAVRQVHQHQETIGQPTVVLVADALRPMLARLLTGAVKGVHVLAYAEVPAEMQLRVVASLGSQPPGGESVQDVAA